MKTAGVYMLQPGHAAAIEALEGASEFLRTTGAGHAFVIEDHGRLVGLCGLQGAEARFWVGRPFRGKGYATFGVGMILEFAFQNLALAEVRARVDDANPAARRVLEKNGFLRDGSLLAITADRWRGLRHGPALERLHPALRAILAAERAAGNEVRETAVGWPDADSVFVRLKRPFRAHAALPEGVRFAELNDPHWWMAEYSTEGPRHILAY
jgi:hypothetical protein